MIYNLIKIKKSNFILSLTFYTTIGEIKVELFYTDELRDACKSFLKYVASGKYSGKYFYRTIPDFLIQTGFPDKDSLEMSCNIKPNSYFSEFDNVIAFGTNNISTPLVFITVRKNSILNGKYTAIGKVIFGSHNVKTISRQITYENNTPVNPVKIEKVVVHHNPAAFEE